MTFTRESKGGSRSRARVTTVRRLLVLVTLLFHDGEKKKEKKKKNQLFISRRLNREPQTWWMVKGSKRTFPFSVRDGSRSMETANPSLTESKTVKTIHFFDISLLSPPIY